MKPRVFSAVWTDVASGAKTRRWHVEFDDDCGCRGESDFKNFLSALSFAYHVATGGSRWEFTA